MTETMIERVTQAILREARENRADSPVDYGDAEQLARAAIEAMRNPTDAMLRGVLDTGDGRFYIGGAAWSMAIDLALEEG